MIRRESVVVTSRSRDQGRNQKEAVGRAVNETRDNDTIASIVRAAAGALYARPHLPRRWLAASRVRTIWFPSTKRLLQEIQ